MTTPQLEAFREVYGVDIDPDREPVKFFLRLLDEANKTQAERQRKKR